MVLFQKKTRVNMPESQLDLTNIRMKFLIERENLYEFPEFITRLRKVLGKSKSAVSIDLGISYDQLFRLECGRFLSCKLKRIEKIAEYYGVFPKILEEKCRKFLKEKKNGKPI